jgi:hypothetical protein
MTMKPSMQQFIFESAGLFMAVAVLATFFLSGGALKRIVFTLQSSEFCFLSHPG